MWAGGVFPQGGRGGPEERAGAADGGSIRAAPGGARRQGQEAGSGMREMEPGPEWVCGGCGESSPGTFEKCWNCGKAAKRSETG